MASEDKKSTKKSSRRRSDDRYRGVTYGMSAYGSPFFNGALTGWSTSSSMLNPAQFAPAEGSTGDAGAGGDAGGGGGDGGGI